MGRSGRLAMVFILSSLKGFSQEIGGRITDASGQPLPLVSVILLRDSQMAAATVSTENGHYRLNHSFEKDRNYLLRFSLLGYNPRSISFAYPDTAALLRVVLQPNNGMMQGISVTGKKPLITQRADRFVINVENSILANGRSGLEVLQASPGVWVNNNGYIRLKGTQPVMVMINDVVQRMTDEELADYLRGLRSEDISRIEVIPLPPAEYESGGAGGIIHIILKKGRKSGWNGSVFGQYWQQGNRPYFTGGTNLNYQWGKLYVSGSYSYTRDRREVQERTRISYPGASAYYNTSDREERIGRNQYRLGAGYDISKNQNIGIQAVFTRTRFDYDFISRENYINAGQPAEGTSGSSKRRLFNLANATINYSLRPDTLGTLIQLIGDYLNNDRDENNFFRQEKNAPATQQYRRNFSPMHTRIYSLQLDYTRPLLLASLLKTGAKYSTIQRDNLLLTEEWNGSNWMQNPGQSNQFIYTESLLMAYASLEKTVKKTVVKAGLRAEQTWSDGNAISIGRKFSRSYGGLFPSVFLMQTFNAEKGRTLTAGYARRLTRPSLGDLNPARLEFSSYTALIGNPDLKPQYSQHLTLNYHFTKDYSAEFYFIRTTNSISLSAYPGMNNSIDYYSENTGRSSQYGLEFISMINPLKKWTMTNNFSAYRLSYRFHDQGYNQFTVYIRTLQTITLPAFADLELSADYQSPHVYTNLYTYGNFNMDIAATRKIFHSKGRLRLGLTDVFNSSREKELTDEASTRIEFYRKRPTRTLRLSLTYNFSSGKIAAAKKIEQANNEERSRAN